MGQLAPKASREQLVKRALEAPKAPTVILEQLAPQDLAEVRGKSVLRGILAKTMGREPLDQRAPKAPGAQPAVKVPPEVTAKLAVRALTVLKALLDREAIPGLAVTRGLKARWVQMV